MSAPQVDVVIVNYHSTDHLLACLESVYRVLGATARVWVEDNASGDDPRRVLARFPQVALTLHRRNLGFAAAVNRGLSKGGAPYVMLLNPDAVLLPGGWPQTLAYLDQEQSVGVLGPRILDPDGSLQGSARSFHTLHTAFFGRQALLTKWFPNHPLSRSNVLTNTRQGYAPSEVDWVSGACLIARRRALREVGGLDERFFLYFEDTDWCRRMWQKGWRVVYLPLAKAVHQIAASSGRQDLLPLWQFHKSCYRYLQKYDLAGRPCLLALASALIGARFYVLALPRLARRCWLAVRRSAR